MKTGSKKKKGFLKIFAVVWAVFLVVTVIGTVAVDTMIYVNCQKDVVDSIANNLQGETVEELRDIKLKEAREYAKNGFEGKESLSLEEETICKQWLTYDMQGTNGKYTIIKDMEDNEIYHTRESVYLFFNGENSSQRQMDISSRQIVICTEESIIKQIVDLREKQQKINNEGKYEMLCKSAYFKGAKFYPEKVVIRDSDTREVKEEITIFLDGINLKGYKKTDKLSDTYFILSAKEEHVRQGFTGKIYIEEKERDEEYLEELREYREFQDRNFEAVSVVQDSKGTTCQFHNSIWEDEVIGNYTVTTDEGESYHVTKGIKIPTLSYCMNDIILSWIVAVIFSIIVALVVSGYFYYIYKKEIDLQKQQKIFSNSLAHDLKTPLMAISGYTDNLLEHTQPEKEQEYMVGIQENVGYMNDLIGQVLTLIKIEQTEGLKKTQLAFSDMIKKYTQLYKGQLSEKNLTVEITGETVVTADVYLVEHLLLNLLDNAVRYATENTTIEVALQEKEFSIVNVCNVLTKEEIQQICNPFVKGDISRSRAEKGGCGLGLSIVKEALESCGWKGSMVYENGKVIVKIEIK